MATTVRSDPDVPGGLIFSVGGVDFPLSAEEAGALVGRMSPDAASASERSVFYLLDDLRSAGRGEAS